MEQWKEFLDRDVKLIFEDGENHFSKKEGKVIEINDTHIVLLIKIKQFKTSEEEEKTKIVSKHEAINLSKVLRIEEVKNGT